MACEPLHSDAIEHQVNPEWSRRHRGGPLASEDIRAFSLPLQYSRRTLKGRNSEKLIKKERMDQREVGRTVGLRSGKLTQQAGERQLFAGAYRRPANDRNCWWNALD